MLKKLKKSSSFLKDFLSYGLVGALSKTINLFAIPIYVRLLDVKEFGKLDLFSSSLAIFSLISTFQLETSFLRFYSELKDNREIKKYFSTGLNGVLILLLPFCIISYYILYPFFREIDKIILIGIILLIPIQSLFAYITCIFRVTFNMHLFVKINMINILGVPILSLFSVFLGYGVFGVVLSTFVVNTISLIVVVLTTKSYYIKIVDKTILKSMFSYSLPLIPSSLSIILQQNITRFVIVSFLGLNILGYYAFAIKVFIPFTLIIQSLKMAWYPRAYQMFDKDEFYEIKFKKFEKYYIILISVLFLFLILISQSIIELIGGEKMESSKEIVAIIGLIFLIRAANYFYIVVLNIKKETKLILLINFVSLIFLSIIFIIYKITNNLNIKNIIVAEVFSEFIKLLLVYYYSKRQMEQSFNYFYSLSLITIITLINLYFFL